MHLLVCDAPFAKAESPAFDLRSSGRMFGKVFSISDRESHLNLTECRTTTSWSRRQNRLSLAGRWSTHPISPISSSPDLLLYRSSRILRWSTTHRRAFQQTDECSFLDYTTSSVNGWTITPAITHLAYAFVGCDRRHRDWRRSHLPLRQWTRSKRGR